MAMISLRERIVMVPASTRRGNDRPYQPERVNAIGRRVG
jgi:hypothetical protein